MELLQDKDRMAAMCFYIYLIEGARCSFAYGDMHMMLNGGLHEFRLPTDKSIMQKLHASTDEAAAGQRLYGGDMLPHPFAGGAQFSFAYGDMQMKLGDGLHDFRLPTA